MIHSAPLRPRQRAPRVNLQGTIPATVQLENGRNLPAKLHLVSSTGGLLELSTCLDERTNIRLTLPFDSGTVYSKAQVLFPMLGTHGYLQPFRFASISEDDRQILEREITTLLKQAIVPAKAGHRLGFRPPPSFLDSF